MPTARRIFLFFTVAALFAAIFAVDSPALRFTRRGETEAVAPKTNAERMRRGLTPLKPRKAFEEATPAGLAARSQPSSTPYPTCPHGGNPYCCLNVLSSLLATVKALLKSLGIKLDLDVPIGLTCSVLQPGSKCTAHSVCCDSIAGGGLCGINCKPL